MKRAGGPASGMVAVLLGCAVLAGCSGDDAGPAALDVTTTSSAPVMTATTVLEPVDTTVPGSLSSTEPAPGVGTMVWALHVEPDSLGADLDADAALAAGWIRAALWEGLFAVGERERLEPRLLVGDPEPELLDDGSMRVVLRLREGLVWSDGTPLDASQVAQSLRIVLAVDPVEEDPDSEAPEPDEPDEAGAADAESADTESAGHVLPVVDRGALADIVDVEEVAPLEVAVTWSRPVGSWRNLLPAVFPTHLFDDDPVDAAAELDAALRSWSHDGVLLPSSGPLVLESWSRGVNMRLVRNERYHGPGQASLEAVLVRFVESAEVAAELVRAGGADVAVVPADTPVPDAEGEAVGVRVEELDGSELEVLSLGGTDPHLSDSEVRRALALAINRRAAAAPGWEPAGSAVWLSHETGYVDHAAETGIGQGNLARAIDVVRAIGYLVADDGRLFHLTRGFVELSLAGGPRVDADLLERVAAGWRALGMVVEVAEAGDASDADVVLLTVARDAWPGSGLDDVAPEAVARCDGEVLRDAATSCFADLDRALAGLEPGDPVAHLVVAVAQRSWLLVTAPAEVELPPPLSLARGAGPLAQIVGARVLR